ncbi:ATP-binding protein [Anaerobaca lacustris]|uniref:ATP-binding protein n=1 Tax=Anaerobaca lacustris TaxID=3044600 RepID=A0AAW6U758_9BACT|nr:ATP-binding protein [Sedimentisphaerales bacterium M17dextr]
MKELVVISGKGGTGKTSITAAFASLAQNAVLADCDVDAADLHLVLEPNVREISDFSGGKQAAIDTQKCIGCGRCEDLCRFDAIRPNGPGNTIAVKTYTVDPVSCEGCKVCVEFCPVDAIAFNDAINGQWFISDTRFGSMVHAKLGIAEENSGKLVTLIRQKAKEVAVEHGANLIIADGSPGIGCPVIASITGADLVLIVTEPTLSGRHDLGRVADLTASFGIRTLLCINKADINPQMTARITEEAHKRGIKMVGEIPYDDAFTKAQIMKATVPEYTGGEVTERIKALWRQVTYALG